MTRFHLIISNLKYYRKSWLTIWAGLVISTAVLTGALVVGDSVRYSLKAITASRLGNIRFAIQSGDRFFRQQLAGDLFLKMHRPVASVLQLEGMAANTDKDLRANRVQVVGISDDFMRFWPSGLDVPAKDEAILSRNIASKLQLTVGDEILLKVNKKTKASENAPFVSGKETLASFRLKVTAIADDLNMGRFSLGTSQSAPFNIFVNLTVLAARVGLPENANLLLIAGSDSERLSVTKADSMIRLCWQPEDAGLSFRKLNGLNRFEIRSDRIFIDDSAASAIRNIIPGALPVLTYLVNSISDGKKATPYSFVTAARLPDYPLTHNGIVINSWLADDLGAGTGDSLCLRYFKMGALRRLTEDSAYFIIKAILPISNPIFDPSLMPDFPGMSDAGNCRDWETGVPIDLNKIRDKDEQYWNNYRGTPKAFISPEAGATYWSNAFGKATAFRFTADSSALAGFKNELMNKLVPSESGLVSRNVYAEGLSAADNSTDFGGLFLSLSFFIIAAALLLTGLLFSLQMQKRLAEAGTMATLGIRKKQIIQILFIETVLVILAGSLAGIPVGIAYNEVILLGLNTLCNDAVRTSLLQVHLVPGTLLLGFAAGVVTALLTVLFLLLRSLRTPLAALVKGNTPSVAALRSGFGKKSLIFMVLSALGAVAAIIYSLRSGQADQSEIFLMAGALLLLSGIFGLHYLLQQAASKPGGTAPHLYTMMLRSFSIRRRQTLTAVTLLALGTFTVIITGANRKSFDGSEMNRQSGTGGFLFWAESTFPVLNDLNTPAGKTKYGLTGETALQNVRFSQLLRLKRNDASCLNLNQVAQPTMLGVQAGFFDSIGAFSFSHLVPSANASHPWLTLNKPLAAGVIPCFADQTVITYGLQKNVGDTLFYFDELGNILKVKIMGGLDNSIFQGNILVSATLFNQYFPSGGSQDVMLIDGDYNKRAQIAQRLEYLFQDYGMVVTPASERLATFNTVENTYLSVFMILGGMGILLGTFGLGIVVLRSIYERQTEIAIYQAVGFRKKFVYRLLAKEYLIILVSGLGIGCISAITGLLPTILHSSVPLPWAYITGILALVFISGLVWIIAPIQNTLNKNLLKALRNE